MGHGKACTGGLFFTDNQKRLCRIHISNYSELLSYASDFIPPALRLFWLEIGQSFEWCCAEKTYELCKEWNQIMTAYLECNPQLFRFFKSYEVLLGYGTTLHSSEYAISDWGKTLPVLAEEDSDYLMNIDEVVSEISLRPRSELLSLDEFLRDRGNFAVDGSAGGAFAETIKVGDITTKVRSKKEVFALMSDDRLRELVWSASESATVFPKPDERGKARSIVLYPNASYLRCCFLTQAIDLDASFPYSPLEKGPKWMAKFAQRVASSEDTKWAIDQSAFDEHQHPKYIERALSGLLRRCSSILGCEGLAELELLSFRKMVYRDMNGKLLSKGTPFLPSGHRLTSMLGTILNRASFLTVKRRLGLVGDSWHMGDDLIFLGNANWESISREYESLGLSVNRSKSLVSNKVGEFLRMLFCESGVYTYPNRVLSSILWESPLVEAGYVSRIRGLSDLVRTGIVRGLVVPRDFWRSTVFKMAPRKHAGKFYAFLRSPAAFGGLGWGRRNVYWLPVTQYDRPAVFSQLSGTIEQRTLISSTLESRPPFKRFVSLTWRRGHSGKLKVYEDLPYPISGGPPPPNPVPGPADGPGWWSKRLRLEAMLARLIPNQVASCVSNAYKNTPISLRKVSSLISTLGRSVKIIQTTANISASLPYLVDVLKRAAIKTMPSLKGPIPLILGSDTLLNWYSQRFQLPVLFFT